MLLSLRARMMLALFLTTGSAEQLRAEGPGGTEINLPAAAASTAAPTNTLVALPAIDETAVSLASSTAEVSGDRIAELEARIYQLEFDLAEIADKSSSAPAATHEQGLGTPMITSWGREGFQAQSENKEFKIHVGGRVQLDGVALSAPDLVLGGVGAADAVDFRRARLRIDGTMYYTMQWAAEFDFVNAFDADPTNPADFVNAFGGDAMHTVAPTDLWWDFGEIPWIGNLRLGNQKEPIGLEHIQSSRFLDFMERSYLQDAFFGPFNNGFSPGVMVHNYNEAETVTWQVGAYKNTQNVFAYDTGDNEYALTGRITCVPWSACEDSELVHLGFATSFRGLDQDEDLATGNIRVRSRASLRNGPGPLNPTIADTNFAGRIFAENQVLLAPEAAYVHGPWHFQTEYVGGFINGGVFTPIAGAPVDPGQVFFQGSYVNVLYFLTGEHSHYDRHEARFARLVPYRNASMRPDGSGLSGPGAWQVGLRYGFLDLTDAGINGGYIQDITVGLNWFLNPHAKLQFNVIADHVDNTLRNATTGAVTAENDAFLTGFGMRFACDF